MIQLVLLTGISGSGKSVALRLLEDIGYTCIDNLPIPLLLQTLKIAKDNNHTRLAIAIDAKNPGGLLGLSEIVYQLRQDQQYQLTLMFLEASTPTLVARYSESRRPHPMAEHLRRKGQDADVQACIEYEREQLAEQRNIGLVIDSSNLSTTHLRAWIRDIIGVKPHQLVITFQSFAFKHGAPSDADFLFDVRCLPNPFYEKDLRPLCGKDTPIQEYFAKFPLVEQMQTDIQDFLLKWIPAFSHDTRAYLNIAVGCTGGQHRSVYLVERLAQFFQAANYTVLTRHRTLPM